MVIPLQVNISEELLIKFYSLDKFNFDFDGISSVQLANIYLNLALVQSSVEFIQDQCWLSKQQSMKDGIKLSYEDMLNPFFADELAHLDFLHEVLINSGDRKLKSIQKKSHSLEKKLIKYISLKDSDFKKEFLNHALNEMSVHYLYEEEKRKDHTPESTRGVELYRIFDRLDELFKLDYSLDKKMTSSQNHNERIFSNSGAGVQSGYSTILLALNHLNIEEGHQLVELGSGYGRVGLVSAILEPRLNIVGYEFVPHRVEIAQEACESLELSDSLEFKVQDLSEETFSLPEADIFYLYDPFNESTYKLMTSQILNISRRKKVTVVTKGNAKKWFRDTLATSDWEAPLEIDNGNLCIFTS